MNQSVDQFKIFSERTNRFFAHYGAVLLVMVVGVAYLNCLRGELFLDDLNMIVHNQYLRSWASWKDIFLNSMVSGAGVQGDYYRPLMGIFFLAGYQFWGLNPLGYHLLSVVFHLVAVGLVYKVGVRIFSNFEAAFWAALLFGVHPVYSEAVSSASALGILLGAAALLAVLELHWRWRQSGGITQSPWRVLSLLLLTVSAVLSKETMVVLPGYIFLIEFFWIQNKVVGAKRMGHAFLVSLPYLAVMLTYLWLRFTSLNFGGTGDLYRGASNIFTENIMFRVYTFLAVFKEFLKLIFYPSPIHMEKQTVMGIFASWMHGSVILGGILLGSALAVAITAMVKNGEKKNFFWALSGFGLLWFIFGLVPVSNIWIPISTTIEDGWLYPSALGVVWLFVGGLYGVVEIRKHKLLPIGWVVIAVIFVGLTMRQNRIWADPITFYEYNLSYAPKSARFHNNLGMAYADANRLQEAAQEYRAAIAISDEYPQSHHNLANIYATLGNWEAAQQEYLRALAMDPQFFHAYISLADGELRRNNIAAAQEWLLKMNAAVPNRWESYFYLGQIAAWGNQPQVARQLWRKGQELFPYNKIFSENLMKLDQQGGGK